MLECDKAGPWTGVPRSDLLSICYGCGLAVETQQIPASHYVRHTTPHLPGSVDRQRCPCCDGLMIPAAITPEQASEWIARKPAVGRGFIKPNPKYRGRVNTWSEAILEVGNYLSEES